MCDINIPKYDLVREYIRRARRNGIDWNHGRLNPSNDKLQELIDDQLWREDLGNDLNCEIWLAIKDSEKSNETLREENIRLREAESNDSTLDKNQFTIVGIPTDHESCWQAYKRHLETKKEFEPNDVEELEKSTQQTLSRLRRETPHGPIKGMVIGHVQSGKTTSMAALMNMGADWGFNLFVVLSGRIESLRKQTEGRLQADLKSGNSVWRPLDRGLTTPLAYCDFSGNARHHCVVLKNPTRLQNILRWLNNFPAAHKNIKMLIIDDESDEAGINTNDVNDDERTRINNLIVDLVNISANAVNYVAYTATPYANILNEGPDASSLYPSDFIRALRPSTKYFGPRTIFGVDGFATGIGEAGADGLDIIRDIPKSNDHSDLDEVKILKEVHSGDLKPIEDAQSLCNSIAWFLCAAAVRRFRKHTNPTTMLVHTSQKQDHHERVADAIEKWIQNRIQDKTLLSTCRKVWDHETNSFSREAFNSQFPEYGLIKEIQNYPHFDDITEHIITISSNISHIKVEEDTALPLYHNGIHLCIDNCKFTGVNQENDHVRLLYPDPAMPEVPDFSTAFIVVGGATLSRGLTLQGLVSTYFLRDSSLGDSLLQMGRWFGYRVGYELLPRIWLTSSTKDKFRWLAGVEISLREELKRYEDAGASPAEFGPRVKRHPSVSWLRITARNRMQAAVDVDIDYRGITNQTTMFEERLEWLNSNLETADNFLNHLYENHINPNLIRSSVVYKGVSFEFIKDFLTIMKFHRRNAVFGNINAFIEWFESVKEQNLFTNWNVVVAGYDKAYTQIPIEDDANNWWSVPGGCVKKVNRTRKGKTGHDGGFSIGALLSPKDRLADYDGDDLEPGTPTVRYVQEVRKHNNLDLTPLLVLYRVNKDSIYQGNSSLRSDLNAPADLLGVAIIVPGERDLRQAGHVQVHITAALDEADIED